MKKFIKLIIVLLLSFWGLEVNAEEINGTTIKKIVSIVYDDSGSMDNENEDWAYASYSMQNLIGLMNSHDELNVVKMSAPGRNISIDLSKNDKRIDDINNVYSWDAAGGTPFSAVETAVNWLKTRKKVYADSQVVEYWLVLITDGSFNGYPYNMPDYLNDLKSTMGNSKFEGIFVAIGNSVPEIVKNDFKSVTGNHVITASNSNNIVTAMNEVSGLILGQGGSEADLNIEKGSKKNEITFESYFPLKKFIVFQQNQSVNIKKISAGEVNVSVYGDFTTTNPGSERINSKIIHCEVSNGEIIPAGKITITFDSTIDIDSSKLKILTEPAIIVDLKVLDRTGLEITDLNSVYLSEGELVEFVAVVKSSIDLMPIDLKKWDKDLSAELIVNDKNVEMKYNSKDNAFYAPYEVELGNNLAYAVVTLPGYFRTKSDMLNIYSVEKVDEGYIDLIDNNIKVSYKYVNEYEEVSSFKYEISGDTTNGDCNFEFKNIPNGITISVNDKFIDESGMVAVKVYSGMPVDIKIYRNKDYVEIENSKILVNVTSKDFSLNWKSGSIKEIILNPVKRKITTEIVKMEENSSIKVNELEKDGIYIVSVLADLEYLTEDELETLILGQDKLDGIKLEKKVVKYNGRYALEIRCKKVMPEIFIKTGKINTNISFETIYGEKTNDEIIDFFIEDSFTKYILPILLIVFVVLIIGYLPGVKKRLCTKKYYIQVNGESEQIYVKMKSKLIPYIAEVGTGGDLRIMATSNKNKISIINNFGDGVKFYINDELIEDKKKIDLYVSDKLRIVDCNRENVYIYCNSNNDVVEKNDYVFDSIDDDMFTSSKNNIRKKKKNSYDDEFFG